MAGMNDNADLYRQQACYDIATGPCVALSTPWWIRARHPIYQPRHFCELKTLNCGQDVFASIQADIEQARHSIDIITWGFDPGMTLVRNGSTGNGLAYGEVLRQAAARGCMVRLLVWHDDVFTHVMMKNNPGILGRRFPTLGGPAGYLNEYRQHYNERWFDQAGSGAIPNLCLRTREVPLKFRDSALADEQVEVELAGFVGTAYPTHHQKMVLIDYESPADAIGYVMGHNSVTDFWDTAQHNFRDPLREMLYTEDVGRHMRGHRGGDPDHERKRLLRFYREHGFTAKPYQDVSVRMRGPILYDLNHNFCQAWSESRGTTVTLKHAFWMGVSALVRFLPGPAGLADSLDRQADLASTPDPGFIERRKKLAALAFKRPGAKHSVQLMRTQPMHGEKAIKECYANLNRQLQHYIFIQNQYVQYADWATHLTECVQRMRRAGYTKPFYVFILTSTPESAGMDLPTYGVAKRLGQSETMVVEHREAVERAKQGKGPNPLTPSEMARKGINVVMCSLWTCAPHPRDASDYEEIYIHAKVAIVDDAAFTIGSANLNIRSMALDSELNVLSQAKDIAFGLRAELFRQCAREPGPEAFGDMANTFEKWVSLGMVNRQNMQDGRPLNGQLVAFHVDRKPGSPVI